MANEKFDPRKYLIRTKGQKLYLPVAARILWMTTDREDSDAAYEITVLSEVVHYSEERAVVKSTVTVPGRGTATGIKSETRSGFPSAYLEKAQCLVLRAEILTKEGFKFFDQLTVGEDVLAYDREQDACVWTPLRAVTVYGDQPVVRWENKWGFCFEGTPDHRWATTYSTTCRGKRYVYRRLQPANELRQGEAIVVSAPAPGGDSPLTAEEAAILGWLFTDGHIARQGNSLRGYIAQSRQEHVGTIRALLPRVRESVSPATKRTFAAGYTSDCLPQHRFHLPAALVRQLFDKAQISGPQDGPALACRLSAAARATMLSAMMDADGDKRGNFGKQRKPGVMETFQVLATLQGQALAHYVPASERQAIPRQRLRKGRYAWVESLATTDLGRQAVWCPTTDYGTWVCRQDGHVSITGNTGSIGRALALLGYGTDYALELWTEDMQEGGEVHQAVDTPREEGTKPAVVATKAGGLTTTGGLVQKAGAALRQAAEGPQERRDRANAEIKRLAKEHGYPPPTSYGKLVTLATDQYGYNKFPPKIANPAQLAPQILEEFVEHMKHVGGDPAAETTEQTTQDAQTEAKTAPSPFEQAPQANADPAQKESYAHSVHSLRRALEAYTIQAQLDDVIALVRDLAGKGCLNKAEVDDLEALYARQSWKITRRSASA